MQVDRKIKLADKMLMTSLVFQFKSSESRQVNSVTSNLRIQALAEKKQRTVYRLTLVKAGPTEVGNFECH